MPMRLHRRSDTFQLPPRAVRNWEEALARLEQGNQRAQQPLDARRLEAQEYTQRLLTQVPRATPVILDAMLPRLLETRADAPPLPSVPMRALALDAALSYERHVALGMHLTLSYLQGSGVFSEAGARAPDYLGRFLGGAFRRDAVPVACFRAWRDLLQNYQPPGPSLRNLLACSEAYEVASAEREPTLSEECLRLVRVNWSELQQQRPERVEALRQLVRGVAQLTWAPPEPQVVLALLSLGEEGWSQASYPLGEQAQATARAAALLRREASLQGLWEVLGALEDHGRDGRYEAALEAVADAYDAVRAGAYAPLADRLLLGLIGQYLQRVTYQGLQACYREDPTRARQLLAEVVALCRPRALAVPEAVLVQLLYMPQIVASGTTLAQPQVMPRRPTCPQRPEPGPHAEAQRGAFEPSAPPANAPARRSPASVPSAGVAPDAARTPDPPHRSPDLLPHDAAQISRRASASQRSRRTSQRTLPAARASAAVPPFAPLPPTTAPAHELAPSLPAVPAPQPPSVANPAAPAAQHTEPQLSVTGDLLAYLSQDGPLFGYAGDASPDRSSSERDANDHDDGANSIDEADFALDSSTRSASPLLAPPSLATLAPAAVLPSSAGADETRVRMPAEVAAALPGGETVGTFGRRPPRNAQQGAPVPSIPSVPSVPNVTAVPTRARELAAARTGQPALAPPPLADVTPLRLTRPPRPTSVAGTPNRLLFELMAQPAPAGTSAEDEAELIHRLFSAGNASTDELAACQATSIFLALYGRPAAKTACVGLLKALERHDFAAAASALARVQPEMAQLRSYHELQRRLQDAPLYLRLVPTLAGHGESALPGEALMQMLALQLSTGEAPRRLEEAVKGHWEALQLGALRSLLALLRASCHPGEPLAWARDTSAWLDAFGWWQPRWDRLEQATSLLRQLEAVRGQTADDARTTLERFVALEGPTCSLWCTGDNPHDAEPSLFWQLGRPPVFRSASAQLEAALTPDHGLHGRTVVVHLLDVHAVRFRLKAADPATVHQYLRAVHESLADPSPRRSEHAVARLAAAGAARALEDATAALRQA